ncbi:hypothetical protein LOAG_15357 [Loa loa]|uniref:Uncharacterized protein n=1 Tax=Loa loa TaxID=7209 RepID=A0A1S0TG08_LOALO|nr:hypothetical protein LOAG_15357 [Loa loa]EFO13173.1 hypothetical protein LOAG_15357 [Loa loa]
MMRHSPAINCEYFAMSLISGQFEVSTLKLSQKIGLSNITLATIQCSPYTTDPVDCIGGACCTKSNNPIKIPYPAPVICSNGGTALVVGCTTKMSKWWAYFGLQCTTSQSCIPLAGGCPVICIDGMCCTIEGLSMKLS